MIYVVSVRVHAQDRFERGKKKKQWTGPYGRRVIAMSAWPRTLCRNIFFISFARNSVNDLSMEVYYNIFYVYRKKKKNRCIVARLRDIAYTKNAHTNGYRFLPPRGAYVRSLIFFFLSIRVYCTNV